VAALTEPLAGADRPAAASDPALAAAGVRTDFIFGPATVRGRHMEASVTGRRLGRILAVPYVWEVRVGNRLAGGPADTEGAARREAGRALARLVREAPEVSDGI